MKNIYKYTYILVIMLSCVLSGCRTSKTTLKEHRVSISDLEIQRNTDLREILSSAQIHDYDYTVKFYSSPDSSGNQYIIKEEQLTGLIRHEEEKETTVIQSEDVKEEKKETDITELRQVKKPKYSHIIYILSGITLFLFYRKFN